MWLNYLLFVVGLVLLVKGGDWFVDGATGIAKRFHLPELLIGATVVSIGTTLPEVMVSATSAVSGHSEIAYGNAIGSIICNTALIAALTIAIKPAKIERDTLKLPVLFFFIAAAFYLAIAYTGGYYSRLACAALLLIFAVYMILTVRQALKQSKLAVRAAAQGIPDGEKPSDGLNPKAEGTDMTTDKPTDRAKEDKNSESAEPSALKNIILLLIGAVFIAVGANLLVNKGTAIAQHFGVPESVIALTFVALGTSLPELVTAITSLIKGHGALSVGNIIGANLFNLVLVSGLSITLSPFALPAEKTIAGMNASLAVDSPLMLAVMLIMTVPALIRGKLSRVQGIVLLALYAAFCVFQFAM